MAALADEPHGRPEGGRRAGDDRNAVPRLERLRDVQRAQAAAGHEQPLGVAGFLAYLGAEVENVLLALAARSTEFGDPEAVDRAHRETLIGEEILQPPVDLAVIRGRHRDVF